ncbi:MAG: hypothetical protein L0956_02805 [Candidatus Mariimomonas ferrooxydans]
MKIKGEIQKGLNAASKYTYIKQIRYFKKYIPDIEEKYHKGTINLLLERPLIIFSPDIKTPPIEWETNCIEVFGFMKIKFETVPSKPNMPLDAWIYIPYGSPHYANPFYKEIIAPTIRDLNGVEYCNIIIEKEVEEVKGIVI